MKIIIVLYVLCTCIGAVSSGPVHELSSMRGTFDVAHVDAATPYDFTVNIRPPQAFEAMRVYFKPVIRSVSNSTIRVFEDGVTLRYQTTSSKSDNPTSKPRRMATHHNACSWVRVTFQGTGTLNATIHWEAMTIAPTWNQIAAQNRILCAFDRPEDAFCVGSNINQEQFSKTGMLGTRSTEVLNTEATGDEVARLLIAEGNQIVSLHVSHRYDLTGCAVLNNGTGLVCWGNNINQVAGYPQATGTWVNIDSKSIPLQHVTMPAGRVIKQLRIHHAASTASTIALMDDGMLYAWGLDTQNTLELPTDEGKLRTPTNVHFKRFTSSVEHTICAWTLQDVFFCMGNSANGVLGTTPGTLNGIGAPGKSGDGLIYDAIPPLNINQIGKVVDASMWISHVPGMMVVFSNGSVMNFGHQLYDGTDVNSATFGLNVEFVPYLRDFNVTRVQCGSFEGKVNVETLGIPDLDVQDENSKTGHHCCFYGTAVGASAPSLRCGGLGFANELMTGYSSADSYTPKASVQPTSLPDINTGKPIVDFIVGSGVTCVIYSKLPLEFKCFGINDEGACGQPFSTPIRDLTSIQPVEISRSRKLIDQCVGVAHTCAIIEFYNVLKGPNAKERHVKCFGSNANGQLGRGDAVPLIGTSATEMGNNLKGVSLPSGVFPTNIQCTAVATCVQDGNNTDNIFCWGKGAHLGVAKTINSTTVGQKVTDMGDNLNRVSIPSTHKLESYKCAEEHCCAIARSKTTGWQDVFCWGSGPAIGDSQVLNEMDLQYQMTNKVSPIFMPRKGDLQPLNFTMESSPFSPNQQKLDFAKDPILRMTISFRWTCVYLQSGEIWCWGDNLHRLTGPFADCQCPIFTPQPYRVVGVGPFNFTYALQQLVGNRVTSYNITTMVSAHKSGYVLLNNGSVLTIGPDFERLLDAPISFVDLVANQDGICGRVANGTIFCAVSGVGPRPPFGPTVFQTPITFTNGKIFSQVPFKNPALKLLLKGSESGTPAAYKEKYVLCQTNINNELVCLGSSGQNGVTPEFTGASSCDFRSKIKPVSLAPCTLGREGSACTSCTTGKYGDYLDGVATCVDCPAGTFALISGLGVGSCGQCPAGSFSAAGSSGCTQCPLGSFSAAGASQCTQCDSGSFSNALGQTSCQLCPPGQYQPNSGSIGCLQCPAGRFAAVNGTKSECPVCPIGTFNSREGSKVCELCQPGTFLNQTGQTQCTPCPAGFFQSGFGANNCSTPCAPGFFSSGGASQCTPCGARTFASGSGSTQCDPCPAGTANQGIGATTCVNCTAGSHAPQSLSLVCDLCPKGSFSANNGSVDCLQCGPGTFQSSAGASQCVQCPPGKFSSGNGAIDCVDCPAGFYANATGSTSCNTACPAGTFSPIGSPSCFECPTATASSGGMGSCVQCGDGLQPTANKSSCETCALGTSGLAGVCQPCDQTQGLIAPSRGLTSCQTCPANSLSDGVSCRCRPNFYSLTSPPTACTSCPNTAVCVGGSGLASIRAKDGFYQDPQNPESFLQCETGCNPSGDGCTTGHEGLLCSKCSKGFGKVSGVCLECAPTWLAVTSLIVGLMCVIIYVLFFVKKSLREKSNSGIALKLLLNHLQMLAFASDIPLQYPASFTSFLGTSAVSTADPTGYSIQCSAGFGFVGQYYITLLLPFFALVAAILIATFQFTSRKRRRNWLGEDTMISPWNSFKANIWRFSIAIIFLVHPIVTKKAFSVYQCVEVGGAQRMKSDLDIVCDSPQHVELLVISTLVIVLFSAGWPVFLFFVLRRKMLRGNLDKRDPFSFLVDGFRAKTFFWETITIARKLLFVIAIVFGAGDTFNTTVTLMLIIQGAILLHSICKPYERNKLFWMEFASLLVVFTNQALGLYFLTDALRVESGSKRLMTEATSVFLTVVLFVMNILIVCYFVYVYRNDKTKARKNKEGSQGIFSKQTSAIRMKVMGKESSKPEVVIDLDKAEKKDDEGESRSTVSIRDVEVDEEEKPKRKKSEVYQEPEKVDVEMDKVQVDDEEDEEGEEGEEDFDEEPTSPLVDRRKLPPLKHVDSGSVVRKEKMEEGEEE